MRAVILFSGGKDSNYALIETIGKGYSRKDITLLSLESKEGKLFHRPNINWVDLQAEAMGIRLKRVSVHNRTEIKALEEELRDLKHQGVGLVVSGALASNYQRKNFSEVCEKLELEFFNPLWNRDPEEYLKSLIKQGFEVIFSSYSAMGFDESWLGRKIDEKALEDLIELNRKYGVHLGGEGGEYETFVLNSPLFKKKIRILESKKIIGGRYRGRLKIEKAELKEKD